LVVSVRAPVAGRSLAPDRKRSAFRAVLNRARTLRHRQMLSMIPEDVSCTQSHHHGSVPD
jgi:hypothetical protein